MIDTRPDEYLYWKQMVKHLNGDVSKFLCGKLVYPRQFEIHLPGNGKLPCKCNCSYCAGKLFKKDLGNWETTALRLLHKLEGKIPYHIYGGAYTEPLMNKYIVNFLETTKLYGNHFGIHTNGIELYKLNKKGFHKKLFDISTDRVDYLSISIDAGIDSSWSKVKGVNKMLYSKILDAILEFSKLGRNKNTHALRLCYLITDHTGNEENFKRIVDFAKYTKVDSLRFSIPFDNYNKSFNDIREYKRNVEIPKNKFYLKMLSKYLSKNKHDKPYIFYTGPEFTDIDGFDFDECVYTLYQITYGADGYVYRCSTTATPTGYQCRLGKITDSIEDFEDMLIKGNTKGWNCKKMCFDNKLRCNRMGFEINRAYKEIKK